MLSGDGGEILNVLDIVDKISGSIDFLLLGA